MSLPIWADSKEKKTLLGRAEALGASLITLSDFDVCRAFVEEKCKPQGKSLSSFNSVFYLV